MVSFLSKRMLGLAPILFLVLVMLAGNAKPAHAFRCFEDLAACYQMAATRSTWFGVWLTGMDCELDFTDCTRRAIIGR